MTATPAAYVPVPVHVARQIGQKFAKGTVVIWSHDPLHEFMHITTWGDTAEDKIAAACLGDVFCKAAGGELQNRTGFEDFRTKSAAESAAVIDRQAAEIKELRQLIFDAAEVADRKFPPWVLCDQIISGEPRQSDKAAAIVARIRSEAAKS